MTSTLPNPPPIDPLPLVKLWLDEAVACGRLRNPDAMALATAIDGRPSVRMVLLKALVVDPGYVVFYTHYRSRKARELEQSGRAAAALYWENFGRQVRLEGVVTRASPADSDAYFASRPRRSQLNAWSSEQSQPLTSPAELEARAAQHAKDFEGTAGANGIPRPPFWGGYCIWLDSVELWVEGADRFHERLLYTRPLAAGAAAADLKATRHEFLPGLWRMERLQP